MVLELDNSKTCTQRHVVFCGEIGTGKSSAINLLLGAYTARVSNDSTPCTQANTGYETTLNGAKYTLWDTRGLGEGRNFFWSLFRRGSEKLLKKLLKERHRNHEIDLLVYCIRGSRATEASVKYYTNFCGITRRLAAPVAIVVTQLEKEKDMEDWWNRNSPRLKELGMEFDDHVCITTLPEHPRRAESTRKLVDLITKNRRWEVKESGSYFGSLVQKPVSVPSRTKGGTRNLFKSIGGESLNRHPSDSTGPRSRVPSTESSYHTADSPAESTLPSPVVEPPTPRTTTTSAQVPHIDTNLLGVGDRPQSSSDDSTGSSLHSMFPASSHSSHTLHSEVCLESFAEEREDYLNELPFKHSTGTVRRRRNYATRSGASGDIWECDLVSGESPRMVAVKAIRANTDGHGDMKTHEKNLRRELKVWGKLQHRNVVPLLGVVCGFGPLPSTVSPWFSNGSLSHYLAAHETSKSEKHRLLGDIAVGLCYLHSQGVIHGDLHSGNVLIDGDGIACLADFGLSLISDFLGTSYLKSSICGGVHFADPALVKGACSFEQADICYPTGPCDIYSFGGLMLHVLSGKKPYEGIPHTKVILMVLEGERPEIPTHNKHITHWHKPLMRKCWDREEGRRPSAADLARRFDRQ